MAKPNTVILTEATIVGIILILLFYVIQNLTDDLIKNNKYKFILQLFMTGALFHLIFEFSGLNIWYAKDYVKTYKI
jgi:hypothetical protein